LIKTSAVANRWGFWDLAQFSADYRELFGELPAETPRKSFKGPLKRVLPGGEAGYLCPLPAVKWE
jgi:AraC-like DNA-binding protein